MELLETSKEPPAVQAVGVKMLYIPLAQQAALLRKTSFQRFLTRIFHGIAETGGSVGLARRMGEVWGEQV